MNGVFLDVISGVCCTHF